MKTLDIYFGQCENEVTLRCGQCDQTLMSMSVMAGTYTVIEAEYQCGHEQQFHITNNDTSSHDERYYS